MKSLALILVLVCLLERTTNLELDETKVQVQERSTGCKFFSASKFRNHVKSEEFKSGLPNAIGGLGVIGKAVSMDYNRPKIIVIKDFLDTTMPLIAAGLALFPPYGAIIGGVLTCVWGFISAFIKGEEKKPSPLEIFADVIEDELNDIKKKLKLITEEQERKREARLKEITEKAINDELRSNQYICDKYVIISKDFTEEMKNNRTIGESLRIEMIASIQDCDNFLKDTAEAFLNEEHFEDTLWILSTFTTMLRVSFLAEVCNFGYSLKMDKGILRLFWSELKEDIRKHFLFAARGINERMSSVELNMTQNEYEACQVQRQLIYFDREIFPYGIPKPTRVYNNSSHIKLSDFNVSSDEAVHHVAIYFNEVWKWYSGNVARATIFNCIYGPDTIIRIPKDELHFEVSYVPEKIYQLRVIYYVPLADFFNEPKLDSDMTLVASKENKNDIKITITAGEPSKNSAQRFLLKSGFHEMGSNMLFATEESDTPNERLYALKNMAYFGVFVVENVVAFSLQTNDELRGKITIQSQGRFTEVFIFGVEIIILPLTN